MAPEQGDNTMKKLIALVLAAAVFAPTLAFGGASTDAALGLGAFAVFNQILGGVGIFGRGPVVAAAPVVVAPPPPPVVYAPAPVVVAPAPVVVAPAPRYVPAPRVIVKPYPVYVAPRRVVVHERVAFCPPGHAKKGWCF
jgi:PXPV repeat-containing protein